jgi:hypothetical protein
MKAYLIATITVFGALTLVHVWRFIEEGRSLLHNPFWVLVTLVAAAFSIWGCALLRARAPQ